MASVPLFLARKALLGEVVTASGNSAVISATCHIDVRGSQSGHLGSKAWAKTWANRLRASGTTNKAHPQKYPTRVRADQASDMYYYLK